MSPLISKTSVMIAGIGGASLGTEIYKSLKLAGKYEIYGCDVSSTAYGLYETGFAGTYRIGRGNYVQDVLSACLDAGVTFLVPGGEQPMILLNGAHGTLIKSGIQLLANAADVVAVCSNKETTFKRLELLGIPVPRTATVKDYSDIKAVGLPCVVKPAVGSGGSTAVFFAVTADEAMVYAEFIRRGDSVPIAQEYVGDREGEFTIGVLSLPNTQIVGSIALHRSLDAKLSLAYRGRGGIISSGYSQGHIGEYAGLCQQAELIADAIGSRGPLNIQGRVRDGKLIPFEINPRFSASTYLRALAGFNEIDMLIDYFLGREALPRPTIKTGWYLRSLTEQYVADEHVK